MNQRQKKLDLIHQERKSQRVNLKLRGVLVHVAELITTVSELKRRISTLEKKGKKS